MSTDHIHAPPPTKTPKGTQPIPTKRLPDHLIESLILWGRVSGPDDQGRVLGYYTGSKPAAYITPIHRGRSKFASIWGQA